MWVDDESSCTKPGLHVRGDDGSYWWKKYHLYEDEQARVWPIRCPATLEPDEKERIYQDIPEGKIFKVLEIVRQPRKKEEEE